MTILVTGAAGFIGYHVAKALLARGENVIGIDNLNSYYDPVLKLARIENLPGLDFRLIDFTDAEALATLPKLDRIIHLGAQVGVRHHDPSAYIQSNIVGHLNILELAKSVNSLVYASSSSVYGANPLPFMEKDITDSPISLYGATKKSGELMSESYSRLYGIPMTGLRFFTVYGPWGRPDMAMWKFTKAISEDRPISLFNHGRMQRDFTYIDDVVAAVLACSDKPPRRHAIYNVGNSRSEPLSKVVELIEQAVGRQAIVNHQPIQPGETTHTHSCTEAIQRAYGWEPTTNIEEGIPRFVDWYRHYERQSRTHPGQEGPSAKAA